MTITDTVAGVPAEHPAHGGATSVHHDAPDVVAGRQLVGVWLFIAGDAVVIGSLAFTYMYLRGLNTEHQWMPGGVHGASDVLAWSIVAVAALSALAVWTGDRVLRRGGRTVPLVLAGSALALVALALGVVAVRNIPQAVNPSTGTLHVAGSYASCLLAIDVNNVVHLAVLAFLGVGIAVRTLKGRIAPANASQLRFVRIYWLWVALSLVAVTAMTTLFVSGPR